MAIYELNTKASSNEANQVIIRAMDYETWKALNTYPCKKGSKIFVLDYVVENNTVELLKTSNTDHSTSTGFTIVQKNRNGGITLLESDDFINGGSVLFTLANNTFTAGTFTSALSNYYPTTKPTVVGTIMTRRSTGSNGAQQNSSIWRTVNSPVFTTKMMLTFAFMSATFAGFSPNCDRLRIGFGDTNLGTTTAMASGVYFEAPLAAEPQFWFAVCMVSSVQTRVQTTIPFIATTAAPYTYYHLAIRCSTGKAEFGYIDYSGIFISVTSITTNLPTASQAKLGIDCQATTATNSWMYLIDYYSLSLVQ